MTATLTDTAIEHENALEVLQDSQQTSRPADFSHEKLVGKEEFDIELTYAHTIFPVEGSNSLEATTPLRLGYDDEAGTLQVIGWDLAVDLHGAKELPRLIARRFLELFSKISIGVLSQKEIECFRNICEQIDYRAFTRSRELPRYHEAKLIRKIPCYLEFLSLKAIQIDPELLPKFHVLNEGDMFGAWFTVDSDGNVVDVRNVTLLPKVLEEDVKQRSYSVEFPDSLKELLPSPDDWDSDEICN